MPDPMASFTVAGDAFLPTHHALGPWGAETMNGRAVGGILARSLEFRHGDPAFLPARLTVDLLRPTRMAALTVTTTTVREGRRIRIADAELHQEGKVAARATAVFLRRSEQPPGRIWTADDPLRAPLPPEADPVADQPIFFWPHSEGGNGDRQDVSVWQGTHRKSVWIKENRPLVEGEDLTPFIRVALAGDLTSALTHWGTNGLQFINADFTLTLSRLPDGPDIGMQTTLYLSDEGLATGSATIFDTRGPIGACTVITLANPTAAFHIPTTDAGHAGAQR